jgi:hypothetical protein
MEEKRSTYSEIKLLTVPVAKPRKSIFCQFNLLKCSQKKKKEILFFDLNVSEAYVSLIRDIEQCIDTLSCTNSLSVFDCFPEDFNTLIYEQYMRKLACYYKKGSESKLKVNVDKYFSYFNLDMIVERQVNELKVQNEKMRQMEDDKDLILCIICLERIRNIIFYPCKHLIYCDTCYLNVDKSKCPTCKEDIVDYVRIVN